MRGHGLTIVAPDIEGAVLRAIYTQKNAIIQTKALLIQAAYFGGGSRRHTSRDVGSDETTATTTGAGSDLHYLSAEEAVAATEATIWSVQRPWALWLKEVEACELYSNSI
jgi:hypothetical protein